MHDELMTIGDLSQRTGVSVKTIRRYTDQGLVCTAGRSDADYRLYDDTAVSCINSIRTLRSLGLSLDDVARLHAFYGQEPRRPVGPWLLARLAEVRRDVDHRMAQLARMRDAIDAFTAEHADALGRNELDDIARDLGRPEGPVRREAREQDVPAPAQDADTAEG